MSASTRRTTEKGGEGKPRLDGEEGSPESFIAASQAKALESQSQREGEAAGRVESALFAPTARLASPPPARSLRPLVASGFVPLVCGEKRA
ncbi:unnamed protein product [Bursaphelenchus okinawaensis]|uniref:Uncharacterized protein n=1 Tax=Bursaphelenchus okinawaensis TaxID=465554 RepID=A0A811L7X8_9BILA|nr:unnamed protein product [Bursaphelenchus okinawaensis]CAG9119762.1 unnamed protein product [Bursaphelenchus okinawaensis]